MAIYGSTITNFATAPQSEIDIGGVGYNVQDAGKSYSLEQLDSTTTRFEIQAGDQAWFDGGSAVDRSELSGSLNVQPGTPVTLNYQWMMEPGPTNSASWMVVGEVHSVDTALANPNWHSSPPIAFQLTDQDQLQVVARYAPTGVDPSDSAGNDTMMVLWTSPTPIVRGQYYNISLNYNAENNSSGYLKVAINGQQVVNYSGPLGYGTPTYFEEGIYRSTTNQDQADVFRNLTISTGTDAAAAFGSTSSSGTSSGGTTTTSGGTTTTGTSSGGTTTGGTTTGGTTTGGTTTGGTTTGGTTTGGTTTGGTSTGGTTTSGTTTGGTTTGGTTTGGTTTGGTSTGGTTTGGTTTGGITTGGTTTGGTTTGGTNPPPVTTPPTQPTAPAVTVSQQTLHVSPGGSVALGIGVTVPNTGDNVTVNIGGLPKYETITDALDHKTFSGSSVSLTAAEVNSGLSLTSNYRGHGHPTATLTVTATDSTGTPITSAPQTVTVIDPPATTTSSGTSTTPGSGKPTGQTHHHHHLDVAQSFNHHPDFDGGATTLGGSGASKSSTAPGLAVAASDGAAAGAGAKAFALFNQMMAGDFGNDSHFAQATSSLSGLTQQSQNLLTKPLQH